MLPFVDFGHALLTHTTKHMFIQRDFNLTENDDIVKNVRLSDNEYLHPVYYDNELIGWNVKPKHE